MTSLTRETASSRGRLISVLNYAVSLDLTPPGRHFGSVTTIRFFVTSDVGADAIETFVDVRPHALRSARLDGLEIDLESAFDAASGRLALRVTGGEHELVVDAVMTYSTDGEGLHRHVDPVDGHTYLYAMSFLDAAPRWFACFDQPDLKAPVSLDVHCPTDWRVAANGPATEVSPGHWTTAPTGPLATYFTTLIAGPYHEVRDTHDGVELVLHVRRSLAEHLDREADGLFAHTKHCLDELHRLFGVRYPWGEYHQAFVPEFNAGAMENPGCVTLRDQLIFRSRATDAERADRDVTIAHEMAHMWFGDLVTMRWWDDLWLNESFAEYLGHRVCGEQSWPAFDIRRKSWGYAADRRPSTHPVAGHDAVDAAAALAAFDGISYAKGASVLRQLRTRIGDQMFLDGLRRYIRAHADGNASFADLLEAWRDAGADDLDAWAHSWLRTSGVDVLTVDGGVIARGSDGTSARPHAIEVARYDGTGAELDRARAVVDADRTPLPFATDGAALVLLDPGNDTWARVAPTADEWRRMPTLLPAITDPSARVAIWNALELAVADADLDPRLALDVVAAAIGGEPDHVLAQVGRWSLRTAACFLDRPAASVEVIGPAFSAALDGAEPGSGRQLAAARLAVAVDSDPVRLRAWLAGAELPDGLVLDVDLRWSVLARLAELGDLTPDELDAEAAADPSSAGATRAAYCRAARPDPATKAAAWLRLTTQVDVSNYELYALAEGFWSASQTELTAPYVERYFADIVGAAGLRSGFVVERLVSYLYPWTAVQPATLQATRRLLERTDLHAGVRRALVDAGDDLRRALTSRAHFPSG